MSEQPRPHGGLDAALDAAAACYLALGVAKTTAADIARSVGISRAALYRRYGSHEAIFLAVLTVRVHGGRCRGEPRRCGGPC
jgi:AcrR family transcriptional regulator